MADVSLHVLCIFMWIFNCSILLCLIEFILYLTHPGFPFWIARSQDIVEGGPLLVDVLGLLELGFEHFGRVGLREFLL